MAGNFRTDWGSHTWNLDATFGGSYTLAADGTKPGVVGGTTVDLDDNISVEVSVELTYNGSATDPVHVYVVRDVDGTDYEGSQYDAPWGFEMPFTAGQTVRKTFTVYADEVSRFKVELFNEDSTYSATNVGVRFKYSDGAYT